MRLDLLCCLGLLEVLGLFLDIETALLLAGLRGCPVLIFGVLLLVLRVDLLGGGSLLIICLLCFGLFILLLILLLLLVLLVFLLLIIGGVLHGLHLALGLLLLGVGGAAGLYCGGGGLGLGSCLGGLRAVLLLGGGLLCLLALLQLEGLGASFVFSALTFGGFGLHVLLVLLSLGVGLLLGDGALNLVLGFFALCFNGVLLLLYFFLHLLDGLLGDLVLLGLLGGLVSNLLLVGVGGRLHLHALGDGFHCVDVAASDLHGSYHLGRGRRRHRWVVDHAELFVSERGHHVDVIHHHGAHLAELVVFVLSSEATNKSGEG